MVTENYCRGLIDAGLALMTIGDDKIPNFKWGGKKHVPLTKEEFSRLYHEPTTKGVGIACGVNGLEAIDVDLKIFSSLPEQQKTWDELLTLCRDNIADFDDKFVIYRTVSGGYHIIYRCEKLTGNKKIAKKNGYKEALIESRGVGGYIFLYEKQISKRGYAEICEINVNERDCLWDICRLFHDAEPVPEPIPAPITKSYSVQITPWKAYNDQHSCLDLLSGEFSIVDQKSDRYVIKRHGATSPHSGYIYKSNGCMYLFTTGTIYPHEKLVSPAEMYCIKNHGGDWKSCSSDLYKQGYGERIVKDIDFRPDGFDVPENIKFPLEVFPEKIAYYIAESSRTLSLSADYMGCSFLWLMSVVIGNAVKIRVKNGYVDNCVLWLVLVGRAGVGKTPAINHMVKPLKERNNKAIRKYIEEYAKYQEYQTLTKEDRKKTEEIKKPAQGQFIVDDITLEGLVSIHEQNRLGIGVYRDELASWIKDMNKYRKGGDMEAYLAIWSGSSVMMNRKVAKSSFLQRPHIPVLGGVQPSIFSQFTTEENQSNGFVDRLLICYPELDPQPMNTYELADGLEEFYSDVLVQMYESIRMNHVRFDEQGDVYSIEVSYSPDAFNEQLRVNHWITDLENSPHENEYFKSMLPKMKTYLNRFALICHMMEIFEGEKHHEIQVSSVLKAEQLVNYFIDMAKKVKIDAWEESKLKTAVYNGDKKQAFLTMVQSNEKINKTMAARVLGVSRQTIINWMNEVKI
jgi:hypothetical protein